MKMKLLPPLLRELQQGDNSGQLSQYSFYLNCSRIDMIMVGLSRSIFPSKTNFRLALAKLENILVFRDSSNADSFPR